MLVKELSKNVFELSLSDEELQHFRFILVASENLMISTVADMVAYILTHCEQNWFLTVHEDFGNGNTDSNRNSSDSANGMASGNRGDL